MGFKQTTSFAISTQIGGSSLYTSFTHRTITAPEKPLEGHPLIAFAYLTPHSLRGGKVETAGSQVGFFFFGPGIPKKFARSLLEEFRGALEKKHS